MATPKAKAKAKPKPKTPRSSEAKLSGPQQVELCQMLSEHVLAPKIVRHFKSRHGVILSLHAVYYYSRSPHWQAKIRELRTRWETELADEALASKRMRLRKLEEAHERAMTWYPTARDDEGKITLKRCNPGAAISAIAAARQEMEGIKVTVGGDEAVLELMRAVCGEIADEGRILPRFRGEPAEETEEPEVAVE